MFEFFPGNRSWSFACIRLLAESYYGGGEFNEIHRTVQRIKPGDTESWHAEWRDTADRVAEHGREQQAGGRPEPVPVWKQTPSPESARSTIHESHQSARNAHG